MFGKKNAVLPLVCALFCFAGSGCVDGGFGYHLSGTLLDTSGNPLKDTSVGLACYEEDMPSSAETDSCGYFETWTNTGLAWGGCGLFGMPKPPVPQNPGILYLWHEDRDGKWHQTELIIKDEYITKAVRGELYIHIDTIQVKE